MNNHFYHWNADQIAQLEMQELERAKLEVRLIHAARPSQPGLLAYLVKTIYHLVTSRRVQEQPVLKQEAHQAMGEKSGSVLSPDHK